VTPGGRLVAQYITKKANAPNTRWLNGERIGGLARVRAGTLKRLSKSSRRINRPYGGSITGSALKDRIITAFITEEVRDIKANLEKKVPAKKEGKKGQKKAQGGAAASKKK
jgi:large subunit ribosomal protein L34e